MLGSKEHRIEQIWDARLMWQYLVKVLFAIIVALSAVVIEALLKIGTPTTTTDIV
jgi:hypothetical protein